MEFSAPIYDNFAGLEQFLERPFDRCVDILTPAGVETIRVPRIADDITPHGPDRSRDEPEAGPLSPFAGARL